MLRIQKGGRQSFCLIIRAPNNNRYSHLITDSWEEVTSTMTTFFAERGGVKNFEGYITINVKKKDEERGEER